MILLVTALGMAATMGFAALHVTTIENKARMFRSMKKSNRNHFAAL